ncbi:MAG: hypothetical protein IPK97_01305 [Ahniella sp.]|nr:hypothetical protein [Ahniella sp.]
MFLGLFMISVAATASEVPASSPAETEGTYSELAREIAIALDESWAPQFEEHVRLEFQPEERRFFPESLGKDAKERISSAAVKHVRETFYGTGTWTIAAQELVDEHLTADEVAELERMLETGAGRKFIRMLVSNGSLEWVRARMMQVAKTLRPPAEMEYIAAARSLLNSADAETYFVWNWLKPCKNMWQFSIKGLPTTQDPEAWQSAITCGEGTPALIDSRSAVMASLVNGEQLSMQIELSALATDEMPSHIYRSWVAPGEPEELPLRVGEPPVPKIVVRLDQVQHPDTTGFNPPLSICMKNRPVRAILSKAAEALGGQWHFFPDRDYSERVTFCMDGLELSYLIATVRSEQQEFMCVDKDRTYYAVTSEDQAPTGSTCFSGTRAEGRSSERQ